jgi:hypothetical protein
MKLRNIFLSKLRRGDAPWRGIGSAISTVMSKLMGKVCDCLDLADIGTYMLTVNVLARLGSGKDPMNQTGRNGSGASPRRTCDETYKRHAVEL